MAEPLDRALAEVDRLREALHSTGRQLERMQTQTARRVVSAALDQDHVSDLRADRSNAA